MLRLSYEVIASDLESALTYDRLKNRRQYPTYICICIAM